MKLFLLPVLLFAVAQAGDYGYGYHDCHWYGNCGYGGYYGGYGGGYGDGYSDSKSYYGDYNYLYGGHGYGKYGKYKPHGGFITSHQIMKRSTDSQPGEDRVHVSGKLGPPVVSQLNEGFHSPHWASVHRSPVSRPRHQGPQDHGELHHEVPYDHGIPHHEVTRGDHDPHKLHHEVPAPYDHGKSHHEVPNAHGPVRHVSDHPVTALAPHVEGPKDAYDGPPVAIPNRPHPDYPPQQQDYSHHELARYPGQPHQGAPAFELTFSDYPKPEEIYIDVEYLNDQVRPKLSEGELKQILALILPEAHPGNAGTAWSGAPEIAYKDEPVYPLPARHEPARHPASYREESPAPTAPHDGLHSNWLYKNIAEDYGDNGPTGQGRPVHPQQPPRNPVAGRPAGQHILHGEQPAGHGRPELRPQQPPRNPVEGPGHDRPLSHQSGHYMPQREGSGDRPEHPQQPPHYPVEGPGHDRPLVHQSGHYMPQREGPGDRPELRTQQPPHYPVEGPGHDRPLIHQSGHYLPQAEGPKDRPALHPQPHHHHPPGHYMPQGEPALVIDRDHSYDKVEEGKFSEFLMQGMGSYKPH